MDPTWRTGTAEPMEELVTLAVPKGPSDLLSGHAALQIGRDVLPAYMPKQRWFGAKDRRINTVKVAGGAELPTAAGPSGAASTILINVTVTLAGTGRQAAEDQDYLLPVAIGWEQGEARTARARQVLAQVRQFRREGYLFEATQQPQFVTAVVEAMGRGDTIASSDGSEIRFAHTSAFTPIPDGSEIRRVGAEQSNSSILIDDHSVLKAYRRLHHGVHPELEITRFLTETAGFRQHPATARLVREGGARRTEHGFGRTVRLRAQPGRCLDASARLPASDGGAAPADACRDPAGVEGAPAEQRPVEVSAFFAGQLGQRTGELHKALCPENSEDPAFAPEPITPEDLAGWQAEVRESANAAFELLGRRRSALEDPSLLDRLTGLKATLMERIDAPIICLPAR